MRIVVIGASGQVSQALQERRSAAPDIDVQPIGRPELDLLRPETVLAAIRRRAPDVIVNTAAYTAVDQAERETDLAFAVNATGAGVLADAAAALRVPLIHLSTDYVFGDCGDAPLDEAVPALPMNVYGRTKLAGEGEVAARLADHVVLRMAWLYSPFGRNFLKTMLKKSETEAEVAVVADQIGSPTSALDASDAILTIARNLLRSPEPALRGTFHLAARGYASWADFAEAIFAASSPIIRRAVRVKRISTAEYPAAARRPTNSRLDCSRVARLHGITLPHWRTPIEACVRRVLSQSVTAR